MVFQIDFRIFSEKSQEAAFPLMQSYFCWTSPCSFFMWKHFLWKIFNDPISAEKNKMFNSMTEELFIFSFEVIFFTRKILNRRKVKVNATCKALFAAIKTKLYKLIGVSRFTFNRLNFEIFTCP